MELIIDHPKIRESEVCPTCQGKKETGLVVCWSCYRKYGLRNGNIEIEQVIDKVEAFLLTAISKLEGKEVNHDNECQKT